MEMTVDDFVAGEKLSTDYLNHYNEALMLIEMSVQDPMMASELVHWKPVSYERHFEDSGLRCAPGALAAYRALDPIQRGAFEAMCMAMDRMVLTAMEAVEHAPDPAVTVPVFEVLADAFRNLHARATTFINSGGQFGHGAPGEARNEGRQDDIDALFA